MDGYLIVKKLLQVWEAALMKFEAANEVWRLTLSGPNERFSRGNERVSRPNESLPVEILLPLDIMGA